jgi:hypothetical protein
LSLRGGNERFGISQAEDDEPLALVESAAGDVVRRVSIDIEQHVFQIAGARRSGDDMCRLCRRRDRGGGKDAKSE